MKMRQRLAVAVLLGLLTVGARAAVELEKSIPESVNMVARIDVRKLCASDLITGYRAGHEERFQAFAQRLYGDAGVKLEQIDTVWALMVGQTQGLVAMKGTFEAEALKASLAARPDGQPAEVPGSLVAMTVPDPRTKADRLVVLLDPETLVAGVPAQVLQFVDGLNGKGATYAADNRQVRLVSESPGTLAIGALNFDRLVNYRPAQPAADGTAPAQPGNPILDQIGGFLVTGNVAETVGLELRLMPRRAEQLEGLAALVNGMFVGLWKPGLVRRFADQAKQGDPAAAVMLDLVESLAVTTDEGGVLVSMSAALAAPAPAPVEAAPVAPAEAVPGPAEAVPAP